MSSPLIFSFGSVNIDVTMRVSRLPLPGETLHASGCVTGLGGKGANQAAAAARLLRNTEGRAVLGGCTGGDAFGAMARATLGRFGVDMEPLREDQSLMTGIAIISIDAQGENCITVAGGANLAVGKADLDRVRPWISRASALLLQLELPVATVTEAARIAAEAGVPVILDPAPPPSGGLPDALWKAADIITPNETETAALTGLTPHDTDSARAAAESMQARGARGIIIKMGGRGTFWTCDGESGFVPPFPVTPCDTVAAGDCFNAGLAVGLTSGLSFPDAVRQASACGALATTRAGAADAAPEMEEVQALLSAHLL